jgi:hypothetical protein
LLQLPFVTITVKTASWFWLLRWPRTEKSRDAEETKFGISAMLQASCREGVWRAESTGVEKHWVRELPAARTKVYAPGC